MPRVFTSRIITEDNALGGSKIEKSLRFNGSSTYLSRTPSSASNRKTWTYSFWFKFGNPAGQQVFFSVNGNSNSTYFDVTLKSDETITIGYYSNIFLQTNQVFKDVGAWYHMVVAFDSTQATGTNRLKLYINGSEVTSLDDDNRSSLITQDGDFAMNSTGELAIGRDNLNNNKYFDGYMAEINHVDGQFLDPSYFGFTDSQTGIWMPKRYEGTYGTNGFYLDFGNASSGDEYQKYTVPTASFTNDSDTLLLINNNESNGSTTFTDSSSNGYSISGTGSIAHSTAQSKFGSSSILFDGSDDSLSVGGNGTLYSEMTASSNKTYEAFMYLNADDYTYIMSISSNQRYLGFYMNASSGKFGFNGNHPNPYTSVEGFVPALDIPIGRWFHVFVQRNADGTMSVGFDGKILTDSVAEGADVSATGTTGPLKIGSQHYYGSTHRYFYDGYMDEIRMSDTPRYTALGGAGTVGQDYSGNNNNFAPNSFSLGGVVKDSPTNNFATWNVLDGEGRNNTFSEGNLKNVIAYQGNAEESGATLAFSSGKWYWEEYMQSSTGDASNDGVGVKSVEGIYSNGGNHWRVRGNGGESDHNGSQTNVSGFSWTTGDIIGIAVDMDDGNWTVSKNGTFIGANIHTNVSGTVTPTMHNSNGSENHTFITNFGQDSTFANTKLSQGYKDAFGRGDFYYPVPSGYQALCSANLPPTAPSILKPQKHFDTILYSGTGSSNSITGLEFAPDFIWAKRRDTGGHHHLLVDTIRGGSKSVMSNLSDAENSNANRDMTFLDNGIRWNSNTGNANASGGTYVVWSWKGGGTAVSNTDGSITSSVSVNQEAGFSICSFTINTSGVYTIGHGLGKAPDWIMMKNRDTSNNWDCYHSYIGNTKRFKLNSRDAGQDYTEPWNDTTPTSSGFTSTGSWLGGDGNKIIAYCWTSIPGYSKMGGYRGSGSSDGPYIHLGFRPAWILIKADLSESWYLYDNKRDPFNVVNNELRVDHDYVAGTFTFCEFLSDGFRILATDTNSNGDGSSYFYIAFAEQPGTTPFDTFPNAR